MELYSLSLIRVYGVPDYASHHEDIWCRGRTAPLILNLSRINAGKVSVSLKEIHIRIGYKDNIKIDLHEGGWAHEPSGSIKCGEFLD